MDTKALLRTTKGESNYRPCMWESLQGEEEPQENSSWVNDEYISQSKFHFTHQA